MHTKIRENIPEDKHSHDDEPWRYRCPNCDSTTIRKRVGHVHEMSDSERGAQYPQNADAGQYYCDRCSTPLVELYDAQAGETIYVGTIEP